MAPGVKRRMPERLTEEAKGFQLMDISFRSFQVNNGWNQVRQAGARLTTHLSSRACPVQRRSLRLKAGTLVISVG